MSLQTQSVLADSLLRHQNKDGGWGFSPSKASWLEPTFYAMLALDGAPQHANALDRAWAKVRSWQLPEGGCRPTDAVDQPNWTTALWIQLHCRRKVFDDRFVKSLFWLSQARGEEGRLWLRLLSRMKNSPDHYGWSWFPGSHSWIEPTAHSLLAMQISLRESESLPTLLTNTLKERIAMGQQMLLDRRCSDGGWNYGSGSAFNVPLPSYPETTAVALLGLQQANAAGRKAACSKAAGLYRATQSPLALAWLQLALRVHGEAVAPPPDLPPGPTELMLVSLRMLGAEDGNFRLLACQSAKDAGRDAKLARNTPATAAAGSSVLRTFFKSGVPAYAGQYSGGTFLWKAAPALRCLRLCERGCFQRLVRAFFKSPKGAKT